MSEVGDSPIELNREIEDFRLDDNFSAKQQDRRTSGQSVTSGLCNLLTRRLSPRTGAGSPAERFAIRAAKTAKPISNTKFTFVRGMVCGGRYLDEGLTRRHNKETGGNSHIRLVRPRHKRSHSEAGRPSVVNLPESLYRNTFAVNLPQPDSTRWSNGGQFYQTSSHAQWSGKRETQTSIPENVSAVLCSKKNCATHYEG